MMFLNLRLRRRFAWLALFAVFFGSLAPSLAQAMPAFTGKAWVEICSAAGAARIQVDAQSDPLADTGAVEHCPFLLLLQYLPPLADAALPDLPLPQTQGALLSASTDAPPVALVFRDAHPSHAPPLYS